MAMAFAVSTAATTYYRHPNGVGNRQHPADFVQVVYRRLPRAPQLGDYDNYGGYENYGGT